MSSPINIRKITEKDRDFFVNSADEFYHTCEIEKPLPREKVEAIFNELMRSTELVEGFIIEYDGVKAGYSVISKSFQTEAPGLNVWIEDLYILQAYRSKGLGSEFFSYIQKYYEGKVLRYRLEVEPDNASAKKLYEKEGFHVLPYIEMVKEFYDE